MQEWQEIVKTALIGTQRQPLPPLSGSAPLNGLWQQIDTSDMERSLLHIGAILALWRRAGQLAPTDAQPLGAPAPLEDRPRVGSSAMKDLDRMLDGEFDAVLPDWLTAVAAKGKRVSEERLADLLTLGHRKTDLRPVITDVIGERGRWLAAQNLEWEYALQRSLLAQTAAKVVALPPVEEQQRCWQTGDRRDRLQLLELLRAAEPARATELVAATWSQDLPEDRALFLETFARGLSISDEPLLENALDDRRKEVRLEAVRLLSRLPDSRLGRRMVERARPLLTFTRGAPDKPTLAVSLPAACDQAMQRDGVQVKPPHGTGERAWWLIQILSGVPPSHWCAQFDATPLEIVQAKRTEEWDVTLLECWTGALKRFPDSDWAAALLDAWIERPDSPFPYNVLWSEMLLQAALEAGALRIIGANTEPLVSNHAVGELLSNCRGTWSLELTNAVLSNLDTAITRSPNLKYATADFMERHALRMSPAAAFESHRLWEQAARDMPHILQRLEKRRTQEQFRQEMIHKIEGEA